MTAGSRQDLVAGPSSSAARPTRGDRAWAVAAMFVAALPAVISGIRAVTGKWTPALDDAVVAINTSDVWRGHFPLVGQYTSLTEAAHWPHQLHSLGPLQFWLFASFYWLFGANGIGLAVASAALNALAAAGVVWLAKRRGGLTFAWAVVVLVVVCCWSLGGQVLHDPLNAHVAVLPFLFVSMAAWAVADGAVRLLPVLALAISFVMQAHSNFVVPGAIAAAFALIGLTLTRRRATQPRSSANVRAWPWIIGAAAVAVACWSGPLVDQATGQGNLWSLVRATVGLSTPRVGLGNALGGLVHATSVPPVWWTRHDMLLVPQPAVSAWDVVSSLCVIGALVVLTVRNWRRPGVVSGSALALVTLAVVTVSVAQIPAGFGYERVLWARRIWWPVGVFVWVTAGWGLTRELAGSWGAVRRFSPTAARLVCGGVACVVVASAFPRLGIANDYGSAGFGPIRALGPSASDVSASGGTWLVRSEGDFAEFIVAPGVVAQMAARGRSVVEPAAGAQMGGGNLLSRAHQYRKGSRLAGVILLVSGSDAGLPRPGFRLVHTWNPATAAAPFDSYHTTMFLIPVGPVALFASDGSTP